MQRLGFVFIFFILTLLPGIQMITGVFPVAPVDENRSLAPWITRDTPSDRLLSVMDSWFSDHFGLRDLLIRLKNQVDFSLFNISDRVIIGKDGQLFYRGTVEGAEPAMEDFLRVDGALAAENFRLLVEGIQNIGIRVAVIVNMMSDRFYADLLPDGIIRRPAVPQIDNFVEAVRSIPGVVFVDSTALLRIAMKERRIFHRTDFHWNDAAAFVVGKDLVDRMSSVQGLQASPWTYDLATETQKVTGGIAKFMPLFKMPSENAIMVKQTWTMPSGFENVPAKPPFEFSTRAAHDPRLLPSTVFVGDSFLDGLLRSGLIANFDETYRIRWSPNLKYSTIVASLPVGTQWLVIQFVETEQPAIHGLADPDDIAQALKTLQAQRSARP